MSPRWRRFSWDRLIREGTKSNEICHLTWTIFRLHFQEQQTFSLIRECIKLLSISTRFPWLTAAKTTAELIMKLWVDSMRLNLEITELISNLVCQAYIFLLLHQPSIYFQIETLSETNLQICYLQINESTSIYK